MDISKFYEEEWDTRRDQDFWSYKRNRLLPVFFPRTKKKKKVLDLASGNGIVSKFLQDQGYDVSAIDISSDAIKQAKKRGIKNAYVGNVEDKLPFRTNSFNAVFWGDNIEHVILPAEVLNEIKRVLKRRGRLVLSTPNMGYILYRWHFFKTGELPGTEGLPSEPWEWKHIRFFNFGTLSKFLKSKRFKVIKIRGVNTPGLHNFLCRFFPKLFGSIILVEAVNEH